MNCMIMQCMHKQFEKQFAETVNTHAELGKKPRQNANKQ